MRAALRTSLLPCLLAGALGCTPKAPEPKPERSGGDDAKSDPKKGDNVEPDCKEALATLKRQDWPAWRGLPGCSMAELEDHFPQLSEDSGRANIGSRPVTTEFRRLELEGFRKPIKIWYRDDRIVQIEVLYPEGDVNGLLQSLGEPAAALDYYQRTVAYEKSALIYPERGIAVLTNPDRSAIIRVYLFGKTTLKDYREELHHPVEPARRLPRR